ncbi:MAG: DNA helicase RecQ [Phycisphaerales bacterium]
MNRDASSSADPQTVLREVFGFDEFRGPQRQIIDAVLAGGDALVIMPTGGGKSLCYQLPSLILPGTGIIVSPLIALMADQVQALQQLGVRVTYINSTMPPDLAMAAERDMIAGRFDLVYVSPERLCQPRFLDQLARTRLALFAIDEAHCVSQWGHDFRPEYMQLSVIHEKFPGVPRLALTATADAPTRADIVDRLNLHSAGHFISGFDRPNIRYTVTPKNSPRQQLMAFLNDGHLDESGIIYCLSRKKTEQVAEFLQSQNLNALPYHAGLDKQVRHKNQQRFIHEDKLIIVATIAFGMGIDKPDVRYVAHLDLPKSIEAYYQETGRAGRDGLPAEAWMTYGLSDTVMLRQFIDRAGSPPQQKQIEHAKLDALIDYCETSRCRRQVLINYFGDRYDHPCGNCDTCLNPAVMFDATIAAQKALSCVFRVEQSFGAGHVIDVLLGKNTEKVERFRHDRLSTFGIGAELNAHGWRSVFRQLVSIGALHVDGEHNTLRLTDKSRPILRKQQTVTLRRDVVSRPVKQKRDRQRSQTYDLLTTDAQKQLFQQLRELRRRLADEQGVPPYVVFGDRTLIDMVLRAPGSLARMAAVHGVGQRKLEQYGRVFLDVIAGSSVAPSEMPATEDDLSPEQPMSDSVMDTANRLNLGHTIEQVAQQRQLSPNTIWSHIAEAVAAGLLDARKLLPLTDAQFTEIADQFERQPVEDRGRLKPVFDALSGRYPYEIIRCIAAHLHRGE